MKELIKSLNSKPVRDLLIYFFSKNGHLSRKRTRFYKSSIKKLESAGIVYKNREVEIDGVIYNEYFLNKSSPVTKNLQEIFMYYNMEKLDLDVLRNFFFAEFSFVVMGGRILGARTAHRDLYLVGSDITNSKKLRLDLYLETKARILIDTEKNFIIKYLTGDRIVWDFIQNGFIIKNDLPIKNHVDLKPHNKKQWIHLQQQLL